jgi:hypothetical protein
MDFILPNSSNILGGSALSLFTICSAITGANLVFCDADFEKYLIDTNYIDVIKKTFISLYDENYLVDQIKKLD